MNINIGSELRPCFVDYREALFHRWAECDGCLVSGEDCESIRAIKGIVEYEDGHVDMVDPDEIRFIDDKFKNYNLDISKEAIND